MATTNATGDPKNFNVPVTGTLTNGLSYSNMSLPSYQTVTTTGSGLTSISPYYNWIGSDIESEYDFDTKTIDIEKISKIEEPKRKLIFDLMINFLNCTDTTSKKLMYNTLEAYGVIIEQKALNRKVKISNLTNVENNKS